jgi:NAD(P)-dependent dehydrogenase (short-subunit alcohol dehydrogenase family)
MSLALAGAGLDVTVVADTPLERQQAVVDELPRGDGARHAVYRTDGSSAEAVQRLADAVHRDLGAVGVLLTEAAVWTTTDPSVTPLAEFDGLVDVNLCGPYYAAHHFLPPMIARVRGNQIFIASVSGVAGDPHSAAYSAPKAGIAMLPSTFAASLRPKGIRVDVIAPGAVAMPATAMLRTPSGDAAIQAMIKPHPSPTRRFFYGAVRGCVPLSVPRFRREFRAARRGARRRSRAQRHAARVSTPT